MFSGGFKKLDRHKNAPRLFRRLGYHFTLGGDVSTDRLGQFQYLWDGSQPGWVLLKAPDLPGGYCVFHKSGRILFHMENGELNQAICEKMKAHGCEIIDKVPPGDVEVTPLPD